MKVTPLTIPEVMLLTPQRFRDARGMFFESWHNDRYAAVGVSGPFVQDNISESRRGVLRGLHFQHPNSQGKLVSVIRGAVFDVAVDVRCGSPSFGHWVGAELSVENGHQLWVPPGFAHGFLVLSDDAVFAYKCSEYYQPASEQSLRWNDPAIGIDWPGEVLLLSEKDAAAPLLAEIPPDRLPGMTNQHA